MIGSRPGKSLRNVKTGSVTQTNVLVVPFKHIKPLTYEFRVQIQNRWGRLCTIVVDILQTVRILPFVRANKNSDKEVVQFRSRNIHRDWCRQEKLVTDRCRKQV